MSLNDLAKEIHNVARDHGFWTEDRNFGEMIALIHSELSEALEEHRQGNPAEYFAISGVRVFPATDGSGADWTPDPSGVSDRSWTGVQAKPEGVAVELADALIRILDTMHSLRVDIDGVVNRKIAYNKSRPYKHGKEY